MRITGRRVRPLVGLALCVLVATGVMWALPVDAQIYVSPRRPSQTRVRWAEFDWSHIDILIGPKASGETGGAQGPRMHYGVGAANGAHSTALSSGRSWDWSTARMMHQASGGLAAGGGDQASVDLIGSPKTSSNDESSAQTPPWTGGVRLYFYDSERRVAKWAAGYVARMYRELVDQFDYVPRVTFPYFLYSSYHEFMQTNIFPIQEGVLGVTSPKSLEVTLPYFGDHAQFWDVSKHELAHEFTIQKVATYAKKNRAKANPLDKMPLWFVEGLAEFYAKEGLDPKTETLVRDLVVNPDAERGYVLEGFFDDRRRSFLWTYKLGQARCAFLEQTYGEGTVQSILEQAFKLVGDDKGKHKVADFATLLVQMTGDSRQKITARFESWAKHRHFKTYLQADQSVGVLKNFRGGDGFIQALTTTDSGRMLMYRNISKKTGQRRLYLVDYRAPDDAVSVAADGQPGIESLHPIAGRNFDVGDHTLAFVAQNGDRDVIYFQDYQHTVRWQSAGDADDSAQPDLGPPGLRRTDDAAEPNNGPPAVGDADQGDDADQTDPSNPSGQPDQSGQADKHVGGVDIELGQRRKYRLRAWGIVGVETLALGPKGRRVAFVGLTKSGQRDLFLLEPTDQTDQFRVRRLTDDAYAEREISWADGSIVFTSDATEHGYYNLFRIDPANKTITRLTFEERDHSSPRILADGRVFFVAYDEVGANVYEALSPGMVRKTGMATALSDLSPAPGDGLWALRYRGGEQHPARIPKSRLLSGDIATQTVQATAYALPDPSLERAQKYQVWAWDSWDVNNIFGIVGASSEGVAGQVYATASDRLRDHTIIVNVLANGSVDSIDGSIFYVNQQHRTVLGGGIFQDVGYRLDRTFDEDRQVKQFISEERFFGATATARYPFDRFTYVQGSLAVGGVDYFLFDDLEDCLRDADCIGRQGVYNEWEQANPDARFQTEPSVSLGYNTIRYHPQTGPFMGHSALLTGTFDWQPFHQESYATLRLDAEQYWSIWGRTNFLVRAATGYTFGSRFSRSFFLSSFDTIRGVPYGDFDYLLGQSFFFGTAEFQFPLNFLVRVPFIDIEAIAGADFGAAARDYRQAWNRRVFDAAVGVNFGLGPFVFRLHFAKPFDVGAIAVPNGGDWNTNFSLGWRYW